MQPLLVSLLIIVLNSYRWDPNLDRDYYHPKSQKGVSPIRTLDVIRYVQSIWWSSSAQDPLALSNLIFRPCRIVRFVISTSPLAWGWVIEVRWCEILCSLQNFSNLAPMNWRSLLVISARDRLNRHMIDFQIKSIILASVMQTSDSTSIYLVK